MKIQCDFGSLSRDVYVYILYFYLWTIIVMIAEVNLKRRERETEKKSHALVACSKIINVDHKI